ncbi:MULTISPECIES: signal peptidase I [unclassified Streptomyces]|uniref:signal peptidase I n=1 Tax=unclassified Streptomyces TaxID=2593676 RepID=UPI002555CA15|nr:MULTISPECIES: signal peptidase I [unclassified Streptomyces]WRZ67657.1 signal peptidase I [Streptomyces sp. NBC_01257]WSU61641.1 signal peptidase I [Streptomyces sp. NBC_01104]
MSGSGRTGDGHGRLGSKLSGLAVAVGCVLFLGGFAWGAVVYRPYTVPTESMTPTVNAGDRVLAQRVDGDEVRRGDVVVFTDHAWGDMPMVKRVVGIGGDKIACCDKGGRLKVNGIPVAESYLQAGDPASATNFTAEVPQGKLFLLGDDRRSSLDSRVHLEEGGQGSVPRSAVQARVDAVAWPLGGMIGRPQAFAALPGGVSSEGPLKLQLGAMAAGVVLILGGAVYGPLAARSGRSKRNKQGKVPAGVR